MTLPLLPPGWTVTAPVPGTVWVAIEPVDEEVPDAFRSNLVVTEVPNERTSFRDWQVGTELVLARELENYQPIDLENLEIDGLRAGRRLAHYVGPGGESLAMEQWFVIVDDVGHTLTATVESWRYDELADVLAEAADSWHPAIEVTRAD